MPLEPPNLDTRTYDQLKQQALLRIPRYTPEWTDFNESDPGVTLVELFAWLTEQIFYEMNRIPDRNYLTFLQLIGLELRPAQPAQADLTFTAQSGAATQSVPLRTQIAAQPPGGGLPVLFETEAALDLVRVALTDVQVFDGVAFTVVTQANAQGTPSFRPFGYTPPISSALYLGFKPDPAAVAPLFPQELRLRVFLPTGPQSVLPQNIQDALMPPVSPVGLVWEYRPQANPQRWRALDLFQDDTVGLTREGYLLLQGPQDIAPTVEGKIPDARYWLRCRLDSGAYATGHIPEVAMVRTNTVPAQNLSTVRQEVIGTSDGTPNQIFKTQKQPLQPDSLQLYLEVDGQAPELWTQVDDFLEVTVGPESPVYVLNLNTGEVRLGDGVSGRIPVASARLVAYTYRYGGGTAGNVGAGLIKNLQTSLTGVGAVANLRPAVGGRDEQQVDDLKTQAPFQMRNRNRAVTAEDFTALAMQAGGVAKAIALPLTHPDHPGVEVPGAVTIIIVPDTDDPSPSPSADLITAFSKYINQFRLLTTEVYVDKPKYKAIAVQARVEAQPYAAFDKVAQAVADAVNTYLDALGRNLRAPSAPRGAGWPFGQELHPTNLFATMLNVPDVVAVPQLTVLVDRLPQDDLITPITLTPDGLFYGDDANHQIAVVPATNTVKA